MEPKPSNAARAVKPAPAILLAAAIALAAAGDPARDAPASAAPKPPAITQPILFDTPEADKILQSLQVFPPDNPWNEDVSARPLHPDSRNMIESIGAARVLWYNLDMGFVLVPPDQKRVPVKIRAYPGESDKGPLPVPDNAPIEGWPLWSKVPLEKLQREGRGDRHVIVVDPVSRMLYELYAARRTDDGWEADQASVFDLKTNKLRPDGWTSSDAAGLPVFPATVRYDECARGMVHHALRVTVRRTRRAYVYPARHFASRYTNPNYPRMGERIRLKMSVDISGFHPHVQAILKGLKKYGMFVADNGLDWRISIAPDKRIQGLDQLNRIKGKDFEVVLPTGANEGPRAPASRPAGKAGE